MKVLLQFTASASGTIWAMLVMGAIAASTASADPIPGPGPNPPPPGGSSVVICNNCYSCSDGNPCKREPKGRDCGINTSDCKCGWVEAGGNWMCEPKPVD